MNEKLVKHLFFPLHEFVLGRTTLSYLSKLEKNQWLSTKELKVLQWEKVKRLLRHAYERVPFYRTLFKSLDLHPGDIQNERDFQKVPFLTREIIQKNLPSLVADDFRGKLIRYCTGGSTGQPLIFYTDKVKESAINATKLMTRRWWGIEIGDRQIDLWGSPIELSKRDLFRIFKDRYFLNFVLLSAFNLSEASIMNYLQTMRSLQPMILYGYPTALYRVARFCEEKGIDPGLKALKGIVATAEVLYDHEREKISKVFQRSVINEYGCRDGGYIAQECPAGNMHIAMEHVYVEFIPIDNSSEGATEVTVTNLDGYGMPFIRYRVGDIASKKEDNCPCGRGLALIQSVKGRSNDMLVSPTGKVLHGLSVIYIMRAIQGIRQFKVIQEASDHIIIEIVKGPNFQDACEATIKDQIRKVMEVSIKISIVYRNEILPEKSGKYRWIVSRVTRNT